MNKLAKGILGVLISSTVVAVPTSAFLINKNNNDLPKPYLPGKFNSNINKNKVFNFEFQEDYRHTFDVAREVLRLTLGEITTGYTDLSDSSEFSKYFKNPKIVMKNDIINFIYSDKFNKGNINRFLELIRNKDFFYNYGYKFELKNITSINVLIQTIKNYNDGFISDVSGQAVRSMPEKYNNVNFSDNSFINYEGSVITLSKYFSILKHKNNSQTLNEIKKINGKKLFLSFRLPKWIVQDYNPNDETADELKNISSGDSLGNIYTLVPEYKPSTVLSRLNHLRHADPAFGKIHDKEYAWKFAIEPFSLFKKPAFKYESEIGTIDWSHSDYYDIYVNGNPARTPWYSQLTVENVNPHWANTLYQSAKSSTVPLNTKLYNDKLHNSQSNRYGVVAMQGHNGDYWRPYDIYGNNSWTNGMASSRQQDSSIMQWQYIKRVVAMTGTGGIPDPRNTDMAHRNGAKSLGMLMLTGKLMSYNNLARQNVDGTYPYIEGLINTAKSFGFDGWFLDFESSDDMNRKIKRKINNFFRELRRRCNEEKLQLDYYGIEDDNDYYNDATKAQEIISFGGFDSPVAMNTETYWQFARDENFQSLTTKEYMPGFGSIHPYINPYANGGYWKPHKDAFDRFSPKIAYYMMLQNKYQSQGYGGVAWQEWDSNNHGGVDYWMNEVYRIQQEQIKSQHLTNINQNEFVGDVEMFGYGELGANMIDAFNKEQNYTIFQTKWASGSGQDPRTYKGSSSLAKYFQESTVIGDTSSFRTTFNTNVSKYVFQQGQKITNLKLKDGDTKVHGLVRGGSLADIMPTYIWMLDLYDSTNNLVDWAKDDYLKNTISMGLNYDDAWNGGSSLKYSGTLKNHEKVVNKLYSVQYSDINTKNYKLVYKGKLTPKMTLWQDKDTFTELTPSNVVDKGNGWKEATFSPTTNQIKYMGVSWKNNTGQDVDMSSVILGGIERNKIGDNIIDPFAKPIHINSVENYDFINHKVSFMFDLNIEQNDNVIYNYYTADNNWNKLDFFNRNSRTNFRLDLSTPIYSSGSHEYSNIIVEARTKMGNLISTKKIKVYRRRNHEILYKN